MATYNDLEVEHYYLVQEKEESGIILLQPVMETSKCILLLHIDEVEINVWRKKEDSIYEIVEELDAEQVAEYEALFETEEEDEWDFEEKGYGFDNDDELFGGEEEDDDEETENKTTPPETKGTPQK